MISNKRFYGIYFLMVLVIYIGCNINGIFRVYTTLEDVFYFLWLFSCQLFKCEVELDN